MAHPRQRLLLFDIDGTLLDLQPQENDAYLRAFSVCHGITGWSDDWDRYRWRTDIGIAREILESHFGRPCAAVEIDAVLSTGCELLQKLISDAGFLPQVIPGVPRMLETLVGEQGVPAALVTGCAAGGARLRLESVGLWRYFRGGAFAEDGDDKTAILGSALAKCRSLMGELNEPGRIIFLGDDPMDARAAREHGVHFIGIGYRPHRRQRLRDAGVECIFEDYTDLEGFLGHLTRLWE